ncbi:MAG TPA: PEP-CTERM sorting domain-containing protein, partial [Tepidisphaeraceae bacterium]|nr:PEP-CTERM sorting domain-containing protein [Tepidisphaeraceae bacterium]
TTTIDSVLDMDPSYLDFFNGGGEIFAIVGPFTEFFLGNAMPYDPTLGVGDATVGFTELSQTGTFSVIYEFSVVPEPTVGCMMTLATIVMARRRRRN